MRNSEILNKFRNRRGESIAETLVAMLVIAVALIMFASMVMSSSNLVNTSKTTFQDNYDIKNAAEEGDGDVDAEVLISGQINNSDTEDGISFSYEISTNESVKAVTDDDGSILTYQPVE